MPVITVKIYDARKNMTTFYFMSDVMQSNDLISRKWTLKSDSLHPLKTRRLLCTIALLLQLYQQTVDKTLVLWAGSQMIPTRPGAIDAAIWLTDSIRRIQLYSRFHGRDILREFGQSPCEN